MSHSFGGVATSYALFKNQNIEIDKYVLLTTPDMFAQRIDDVANVIGIPNKVKRLLIDRLENEMGIDVSSSSVSNYVRDVKVNNALIIHDKNDRVISISQSRNVAKNWKNCTLEEIDSTGHFGILRTRRVLERVVSFMDGADC